VTGSWIVVSGHGSITLSTTETALLGVFCATMDETAESVRVT